MGRKTAQKKKYMSVKEMGELLGLGKTERYWILKKGYFTIIEVAGKMWVAMDSFEKWYSGQTRYHKVTGEKPGAELAARSFSVKDVAALFGIGESTAYGLIRRENFPLSWENGAIRIPRKEFWIWYDCQIRYRLAVDIPKEEESDYYFSIPEIADILTIPTTEAYQLIREQDDAPCLTATQIGDRLYVSWQDFGRFLRKQDRYSYDPRKDPSVDKADNRLLLNIRQACWYAKVSKPTIISWCKQDTFPVKRAGKFVRIPLEEFDGWLRERKEKKIGIDNKAGKTVLCHL